MKIKFLNAENLIGGIGLLEEELSFEISQNGDYTVTVKELEEASVSVDVKGKNAEITYGGGKARFYRGLAYAIKAFKNNENKSVKEKPLFSMDGAMIDMSRNAVMKVDTVKSMLRKMALMGLNMFMLYTEDTYEIQEYPYFGHLRGRYTKDEIKELDKYALELGIELIPCIQTLGHLATHLRWEASKKYKDSNNTLLVGNEETYKLIDSMFKTVSECFTTRRIHIGMDETLDLGTGGYLTKYGFREKNDIYFEHLEKVRDMALSYGLKPMMWSDMFFRLAGKGLKDFADYDVRVEMTDKVIEKIPQGVQPVFWDYYHAKEEFYSTNIEKHRKAFKEETLFAGGVWCWAGHCPLYKLTIQNTVPALEACKKHGIKEVIATVWHNGAEASLVMGLASLALYASYDYTGEYSVEKVSETFDISCQESYENIFNYDLPEMPAEHLWNATRSLLYNDPLLGQVDFHVKKISENNPLSEYYKKATETLEKSKVGGIFESAGEVVIAISSLLENKADFGLRLKKAYDEKDNEKLKALMAESEIIKEKLIKLKELHKKSWFEYNKPFGWEVFDIRYGGLISRFETVKERLEAYLNKEIEKIDELEAPRLSYTSNELAVFVNLSFMAFANTNVL